MFVIDKVAEIEPNESAAYAEEEAADNVGAQDDSAADMPEEEVSDDELRDEINGQQRIFRGCLSLGVKYKTHLGKSEYNAMDRLSIKRLRFAVYYGYGVVASAMCYRGKWGAACVQAGQFRL